MRYKELFEDDESMERAFRDLDQRKAERQTEIAAAAAEEKSVRDRKHETI